MAIGGTRAKLTTPALDGLERAAASLRVAAAELEQARLEVERAEGPATRAKLLAEETTDILIRVRAEREKLAAKLPGG